MQEHISSEVDEEFPEVIELTNSFLLCSEQISYMPQLCDPKLYIHKEKYVDSAALVYREELEQIEGFSRPAPQEVAQKCILLGPREQKFTLVLDLDQTLVYCELVKVSQEEVPQWEINVKLRPFATELLREVSSLYEIVIFTAAEAAYAEHVVDVLDPRREFVKKVVSRSSCIEMKEGHMVKDLRIFADRNIDEMLIADDNVYSFAFQLENGVPVKPFEGETENEEELLYLMDYLKGIYEEGSSIKESNRKKLWTRPTKDRADCRVV